MLIQEFVCNTFTSYEVVQEKENLYGIYFVNGSKELVTHRQSKRAACKLAQLLQEAYRHGYEYAKEAYFN